MDSKQMIRLILKVVGFIYWFVFLYLGGLMVMDWSGFMSQHNIETPLFLCSDPKKLDFYFRVT